MTKYDDASWHSEGTYPADLPADAAATHIGMFVAWCLLHGYAGEDLVEDASEQLQALEDRSITPGRFIIGAMDATFTSDDLNDEGNAFTVAYYAGEDDDSRYVDDYVALFDSDTAEIYRVPDTWDTFDRLAPRIQERHSAWMAAGRPRFIA